MSCCIKVGQFRQYTSTTKCLIYIFYIFLLECACGLQTQTGKQNRLKFTGVEDRLPTTTNPCYGAYFTLPPNENTLLKVESGMQHKALLDNIFLLVLYAYALNAVGSASLYCYHGSRCPIPGGYQWTRSLS